MKRNIFAVCFFNIFYSALSPPKSTIDNAGDVNRILSALSPLQASLPSDVQGLFVVEQIAEEMRQFKDDATTTSLEELTNYAAKCTEFCARILRLEHLESKKAYVDQISGVEKNITKAIPQHPELNNYARQFMELHAAHLEHLANFQVVGDGDDLPAVAYSMVNPGIDMPNLPDLIHCNLQHIKLLVAQVVGHLGSIPEYARPHLAQRLLRFLDTSALSKYADRHNHIISTKESNYNRAISHLLRQIADGKPVEQLSDVVTYTSGDVEYVM